jgi:hypothetical protein
MTPDAVRRFQFACTAWPMNGDLFTMGTGTKSISALLLGVVAALSCGCGQTGPDYGSLGLCSVQGTVTLDGTPLEKALVLFEAADATFSYGLTDGSGHYELMFNSRQPGAMKGSKVVRIWSSRGIPGASEAGSGEEGEDPDDATGGTEGGAAKPAGQERIPAKYNRQSELTATVEKESETFNFDLRS